MLQKVGVGRGRGVTDVSRNFTRELLELHVKKKMPTEKVQNEQCGKKGYHCTSPKKEDHPHQPTADAPGPLQTIPTSSPAAPTAPPLAKPYIPRAHPPDPRTHREPLHKG